MNKICTHYVIYISYEIEAETVYNCCNFNSVELPYQLLLYSDTAAVVAVNSATDRRNKKKKTLVRMDFHLGSTAYYNVGTKTTHFPLFSIYRR